MAVREEFHTTQFTTRVHILHFVRAIVVKDASSIRIYLDTISSTEIYSQQGNSNERLLTIFFLELLLKRDKEDKKEKNK